MSDMQLRSKKWSGEAEAGPASPYLEDVAEALAGMLDIAVNVCGLAGQDVVEAFVVSGLAREFERQNPAFICGKSGIELVEILLPVLGEPEVGASLIGDIDRFDRTADYWLGWALAHFQVRTGLPYRRVFETAPYDELVAMHRPLHEAPVERVIEVLCERLFPRRTMADGQQPAETPVLTDTPRTPPLLKLRRERMGLSQAELARRSGTSLRSIQMYEQRNRDIAKARTGDILRIARALGCEVADLVEA